MCDQCNALLSENRTLQAQNKKLLKLVRLAKRVIKKQRDQLDDVQAFCWQVMCKGQKEMATHLPRGTWSLWKGRLSVAKAIYKIVWVNWATTFLELAARVQGV